MSYTFRTTPGGWLVKLGTSGLLNLFLLASQVFLFFQGRRIWHRPAAVLGITIFLSALLKLLSQLWRNRVVLTEERISGRINDEFFSLAWADVVRVWEEEVNGQQSLLLNAGERVGAIPLNLFAGPQLRQAISAHVAPAALTPEAREHVPGFHAQMMANERLIETAEYPLTVKTRFLTVLGWASASFFLTFTLAIASAGAFTVALWFLPFLAASIYLILNTGKITLDKDALTHHRLWARLQIRWDEITEIQRDLTDRTLVFVGAQKCLVLPGTHYWSGKMKERALTVLRAQTELRNLPQKKTLKARFRLSKNVRLKT